MSEPSAAAPIRRYLRAARVVTASAQGTIEDGAVAVEGSRISAVGPAADVLRQVPATASGIMQYDPRVAERAS
jgi:imidazolonepropionase-like amidohydrolase